MLRPELVREWADTHGPLSPDALSSFSRHDPHGVARNEDVRQATLHLLGTVIPALAEELRQGATPLPSMISQVTPLLLSNLGQLYSRRLTSRRILAECGMEEVKENEPSRAHPTQGSDTQGTK